ncbi:MAG: GIY-YIG nuclease family protein [Caldisericia bacterium]|nr:GIY-YIG nuclease family protein [Caldisericia bacterium]
MLKTYILILILKKDLSIKVGVLKNVYFKKGYYIYIGSGKRNIKKRILRHIRNYKKIRWHIDYLTTNENFEIKNIFLFSNISECYLSNKFYLNNFSYISKFGSSDCSCKSHLYYSESFKKIKNLLKSFKKRRFL